jgi:hypothetical protein
MSLQIVFWMIWIIGLLFGFYSNRTAIVPWLSNSIVVWVMLGILGWAIFGAAVHR